MWSGRKSVGVRVDLRKGEALVGTTFLTRSSKRGAVGTCALLDRVVRALGKDIAVWLSRGPTVQFAGSDEPESPATIDE